MAISRLTECIAVTARLRKEGAYDDRVALIKLTREIVIKENGRSVQYRTDDPFSTIRSVQNGSSVLFYHYHSEEGWKKWQY